MEVPGDPLDLVCSRSRGSKSRRLDVHLKRGNSLYNLSAHCRESDRVSSMRTAERVTLYTAAILVFRFGKRCKQAQTQFFGLLASAVLNWLVTHLLDRLDRLSRLRELKHLV